MEDSARFVPAAQYLRMSTEHQQYSLDNQSDAIQRYARDHQFQIVSTYTDEAKSGLLLKRRDGLKQLLQDVMDVHRNFQAILVYDISRWGRFQDSDESAHYEFLCKSAGVPVHYCAESFEGVDARFLGLLKSLKRAMAGEYSRELSVKVFAGQKRIAQLGFKVGGKPGYGLRRMMVGADRAEKQQLAFGERKSLTTDRVILVPGPPEEVECVRSIFHWFAVDRWPVSKIVKELNQRNIPYIGNHQWHYWVIYDMLHHPKYAGFNVYGQCERKLSGPTRRLPRSCWTSVPAFQPIVDLQTFNEAQRILNDRPMNKTDEELIDALRKLVAKSGKLSLKIIQADPDTPDYRSYRVRFGGLKKAFELAGYSGKNRFIRTERRLAIQKLRLRLMQEIVGQNQGSVEIVDRRPKRSWLRFTNGTVLCVIACRSEGKSRRSWIVNAPKNERRRLTLLALLDGNNEIFERFFLVPNSAKRRRQFAVSLADEWLFRGYELATFGDLSETVAAFQVGSLTRSEILK